MRILDFIIVLVFMFSNAVTVIGLGDMIRKESVKNELDIQELKRHQASLAAGLWDIRQNYAGFVEDVEKESKN